MAATLLLRIVSVISLVFTAGHSLGGLQEWSPMGENDVLKAMRAVRFDTMGANRSYLDFFLGFGWSISVAMLLQTMLLWQLAALAQRKRGPRPPDDRRIRPGNARQRCNCLALRLSGAGTLFRGASVCAVGGVLGGALTMRPTRSTTAADCAGLRLFSSQPQPNLHSSQPASASGGNAPRSQFKGSQQW